jgi:fibronectin type 3 domain-containing protein
MIDSNLPTVDEIKTISDMTEVGFEWSPWHDERLKGYYLYRKSANEAEFSRVGDVKDRYASHYVDEKLTPQTEYEYYFTTYSYEGRESPRGKIHQVATKKNLNSVPFVQAIVGLPNRVKLLWRPHPVERVGSYIVERNELDQKEWKQIAHVKGRLNAEFIDTGLKDNHTYRYRILAVTYDDIVSYPSEIVTATTKPLPKMVENVLATRDLPKKILLTWDASNEGDISHYRVYRAPTSVLFYSFLAKTDENSFEDFVNSNGTDRYYKVTAVDKDGLESLKQSAPIAGATLDAPLPPAMTEGSYQNGEAVITWNQVDGRAVKYSIVKKYDSQSEIIEPITSNRFVDRALMPGVKYNYEIISIDEFGLASKPSQRVIISVPKE